MSLNNLPLDVTYHIRHDARARLEIETQASASRPGGYPVFRLGAVTYWPTIAQLERIRAAIDTYLAGPDGRRLRAAEATQEDTDHD